MFSLIISIISIALVAALAAATVYFGGSAFNKGAAGADASAFINAGQQIAGAFTLADTDGDAATTVAELADTNGDVYLSQVPTYKGTSLTLAATGYLAVEVTESVCVEVAKRVNPAVVDAASLVTAALPSGLFGCNLATADDDLITGSTAGDAVAFYKVK